MEHNPEYYPELEIAEELEDDLDENDTDFVAKLVDKCMQFMLVFTGNELRPYQEVLARRMIESVLIEDGATITALFSRQAGKSETVCNVAATLMVLLPRFAAMWPDTLNFAKWKNGFWVGVFAPVEGQAQTLFGRMVDRLTSERATAILTDSEIDDRADGSTREVRLKRCGSRALMMTANPRAKIESKSFHLILIDEAQDCDDYVVRKSIMPMRAAFAGTVVKTGTPTTRKGDFYREIAYNKRIQTGRGRRTNHFEANWRLVAKSNPAYSKAVRQDMLRMGEDSDEFQMSYNLKWLLERGMLVSERRFDELCDTSMQIVHSWHRSPCVVGIDPARKIDATVVTVVWVDWDRPDEFGYFDHRVLNWLELQGDDWENQYFQIVDFLGPYDCLAVGVDSQGVGDAVADRLARLLTRTEVIPVPSNASDQSTRWKHLMALMQRGQVAWPGHSRSRRLKTWQRFRMQMLDAEKLFKGPNVLVAAPDEAEAHDDFVDSLAIACSLTKDLTMPTVEQSQNPFYK